MDRYIGLDAHASSCTVATVGPSGRRLHSQVVETNAGAVIRVLRGIPGTRHLCLEEGTYASWLYEVLSPHVEEIVVAAVRESRGPKSDKLDAFGLAEQLRICAIKRKVYKKRGEFGSLGHRAKAYTLLVSDSVRVQNRIKSVFRSRGVAVAGKGVFSRTEREAALVHGSGPDRILRDPQPRPGANLDAVSQAQPVQVRQVSLSSAELG
jgi:hypothetical protein